jgi:hypothetical protein
MSAQHWDALPVWQTHLLLVDVPTDLILSYSASASATNVYYSHNTLATLGQAGWTPVHILVE